MPEPKISIITPVFNEEQHLSALVASIQAQDVTSWELVLVDDGSTDQTVGIARKAAASDPRIRVVSPGGKLGKVAAFNRAFAEARGQRICHVGGDDTIPGDSLRLRIEALDDPSRMTAAFGKIQFMSHDGQPFGQPIPRGPHGSRSSGGATYTRALADKIFPIPTSLPAEDTWLGTAATGLSDSIHHIQSTVLFYRQHENNSHFRTKSFDTMSTALHERERACLLLLDSGLPFDAEFQSTLRARWALEQDRHARRTLRVLTRRGVSMPDRLATAAMSSPALWNVRKTLGSSVSGLRGR